MDGVPTTAKLVSINLENSGYDVIVVSDVRMAEEIAPVLSFDIVALASAVLENTADAITRLRRSLLCPVMVYGDVMAKSDAHGLGADSWVERFYEPEILLKSIDAMLARKA